MQLEDQYNRRILVIDDNEAIHEDFKMILAEEDHDTASLDQAKAAIFGDDVVVKAPKVSFTVDFAFQGHQGLEMIEKAQKQGDPYIMAFVDGRMPPGWDGIETIQRIWEKYPKLQIIFCTAYSDYSWEEVVRKLGHTDRLYILKKPFDNIEVRQIACSLNEKWMLLNNLDQIVEKRTEEIEEVRDITVFALARLAESRDPETGQHLERIRAYSQMLADQLRKDSAYSSQIDDKFMEDLYRSSPLHDIGKVGIPDCILLKPDGLTDDEFEIMKQHSVIGAESLEETTKITSSGSFLKMAADIARYHHERFNGTGYPEGLAGTDIPLSARIVALADVYDALTSIRVYKPAFNPEIANAMIIEEKGEHFDPVIVDAYIARRFDFLNVRNSCRAFEVSMNR